MTFVSLTAVQITYQTFVVNVIFTELVSFFKIVDAFSSDKTQKKIERLPHDPRIYFAQQQKYLSTSTSERTLVR